MDNSKTYSITLDKNELLFSIDAINFLLNEMMCIKNDDNRQKVDNHSHSLIALNSKLSNHLQSFAD